eukprot:TRINITY_DN15786_c0_g1_i1.p2 TRINITY_DN15786_c0_g1~~TRINITY_DN15786_c0_g1_i1.p2  ORF type:complete len:163 (-),score=0.64 TRINITY_DN15786_c0_g1_i1:373-861(-)
MVKTFPTRTIASSGEKNDSAPLFGASAREDSQQQPANGSRNGGGAEDAMAWLAAHDMHANDAVQHGSHGHGDMSKDHNYSHPQKHNHHGLAERIKGHVDLVNLGIELDAGGDPVRPAHVPPTYVLTTRGWVDPTASSQEVGFRLKPRSEQPFPWPALACAVM